MTQQEEYQTPKGWPKSRLKLDTVFINDTTLKDIEKFGCSEPNPEELLKLCLSNPEDLKENLVTMAARVKRQWLSITQWSAKVKTVEDVNRDHTNVGTGGCLPMELAVSSQQIRDLDSVELLNSKDLVELVFKSVFDEQLPALLRRLEAEYASFISKLDLGKWNIPSQVFVICLPAQVHIRREAYELRWYSWIHFMPVLAPIMEQ